MNFFTKLVILLSIVATEASTSGAREEIRNLKVVDKRNKDTKEKKGHYKLFKHDSDMVVLSMPYYGKDGKKDKSGKSDKTKKITDESDDHDYDYDYKGKKESTAPAHYSTTGKKYGKHYMPLDKAFTHAPNMTKGSGTETPFYSKGKGYTKDSKSSKSDVYKGKGKGYSSQSPGKGYPVSKGKGSGKRMHYEEVDIDDASDGESRRL